MRLVGLRQGKGGVVIGHVDGKVEGDNFYIYVWIDLRRWHFRHLSLWAFVYIGTLHAMDLILSHLNSVCTTSNDVLKRVL
jgi:hypothetical protein